MDMGIKDRVALVTGAGRGIGRQICLTLAEEGASVAVNDLYQERADAVASEISRAGGRAIGVAADVADLLVQYDWSGNVRELRNAIERAFLFCGDRTIQAAHLPCELRDSQPVAFEEWTTSEMPVGEETIPRLADAERLLIARVLKVTSGNQSDAARLLDVERHRLRRKIVLHGLEHLARIRPR